MIRNLILRAPDQKVYWISLAIVVKSLFAIYFIFFLNFSSHIEGFKGGFSGDAETYLRPIENLLEHGAYAYDINDESTYADRTPAYGTVYLLLRLVVPQTTALNLLLILQVILSAVSVWYLAKLTSLITGSQKLFYWTYFLYLFSTYVSVWDVFILTESFATASLIIAVYFLCKPITSQSNWNLLLAGILLTWSILLRPFLAPLLAVFWLYMLIRIYKQDKTSWIKKAFLSTVFFLLPFTVIDGIWVIRNYSVYQKVIPFQYSIYGGSHHSESTLALGKFVQAWGGDWISWNPNSEVRWFDENFAVKHRFVLSYEPPSYIKLPSTIYTSAYNYDSLLMVRELYMKARDLNIPEDEREIYEKECARILYSYADAFKREKPLHYFILAPLKLVKKFLFHSGTYNLSSVAWRDLSIPEMGFKVIYSILYLSVIFLSLISIVTFLINGNLDKWLIAVIPVYIIILCPVVLRMIEFRYFVTAYPFALISALLLISAVAKRKFFLSSKED